MEVWTRGGWGLGVEVWTRGGWGLGVEIIGFPPRY